MSTQPPKPSTFWQKLPKPFFILAPMEDVTDVVFRQIIRKENEGRPEVVFTEFTNCDGICSVGQSRVIHRLKFDKSERPIVAQIWGKTPQNYYETAKLCTDLGFDGIDINMGCPEKNVIKIGACSALIENQALALEIINAVKEGAKSSEKYDPENPIAISVKTRIGFKKIQTQEWFSFLINQNLDAITVHGRTVVDDSYPANWNEIAKVVELNNNYWKNKNNRENIKKDLKAKWIDWINKL
jgi:tRNA-dihydrouridine synthase